MKKTSSLVWRFFDRLEENNRCVSVLCKLCDTQYKYFGNTTNLRTHLVNKHPIQWDLLQNGTLDESACRTYEDDESKSTTRTKRRKYVKNYKNDNVRYSVSVDLNKRQDSRNETGDNSMPVIEIQRVDVLDHSEAEIDHNDDSDILVRQMHNSRNSDEEWLEEEVYQSVDSYEPPRKKMKLKQIKREVQSPPTQRASTYLVHTPKAYTEQKRIVVDNSPRKDEYSVFGEYIANKLRKNKCVQARGNIQQLITTILWQAEYGLYDNMESVKRIILHSVQDMGSDQDRSEQEPQIQEIHSQEARVQMVIEHRGDEHITQESVRIIDEPSE